MDPWFEHLENLGANEDVSQGFFLLHTARFLQQMGVLNEFDASKLPPPASKQAVEELPKVKLTEDLGEKCPICLVELVTDDVQVTMPCKHAFHDSCILVWLEKTNSCPLCRHELRTDSAEYEEHKERVRLEATREERIRTLHHSMYN